MRKLYRSPKNLEHFFISGEENGQTELQGVGRVEEELSKTSR